MIEWIELENSLQKTFEFTTFSDAIEWMLKASIQIEKMNHHPKWTNENTRVHVVLTTHDKGYTVTHKDRELAKALDLV
jgi:4a-hydroxytetrahydrobiopterin dehydratase